MVKALACELPAQRDEPLSRYSTAELARLIAAHADGPPLSRSTIRRILDRDALKPWRFRSWLFPRDPHFIEKTGCVLDFYEGRWEGWPVHAADCIISADEKTNTQARLRCHPSLPPAPGYPAYIEHEYKRGGLTYLAAWDVRRGQIQGRCEATTGKAPLAAWSTRSCSTNPTAPPRASSGSSITAAATAAIQRRASARPTIPTLLWCICRPTHPNCGASADPRILAQCVLMYPNSIRRPSDKGALQC